MHPFLMGGKNRKSITIYVAGKQEHAKLRKPKKYIIIIIITTTNKQYVGIHL